MKKQIYIIMITLVVLMLFGGVAYAASSLTKSISVTYRDIKLVIDGELITPKDAGGNTVEPFIYNGTTYLPVRAVGEAFGKEVSWDGNTSTIYIGGITEYNKPAKEIPLSSVSYMEIGNSEGYNVTDSIIRIFSKKQVTFGDGRQGYSNYVVYPLNAAAIRLTATLNPPKYPGFGPELVYTIYGDGVLLYTSPVFTGDTAPVTIDVDLSGVAQMKIEAVLVCRVWNSFSDAYYRGIENAVIVTTDY